MRILAIDQGTTSTRALILESDGHIALGKALRHRQHHPAPGRVEHDPEELLGNIRRLIREVGSFDALALDNQGESCLAWDRDTGEPLSPVIVWQDDRTLAVTDRLRAEGAEAETLARAGLPLDPYFSASKLAWLLEQVPAAKRRHRAGRLCLGTTDAFFRHRVTGRIATDPSTASRTSLMDLSRGAWDPELGRLFGVPTEALPAIEPTTGDLGGLVDGGAPLRASVVDQQASLFGHGCHEPGDAKITFGTGAFALALTGTEPPKPDDSGLLPTVAWQRAGSPRAYALDGGVYNAGATVEWLQRVGLIDDPAELDTLAEADGSGPAIDHGVVFVPALSGLACPHWDRTAAGLWIGMTTATGRADLVRAALEGVALRTAEVIDAMDRRVPLSPTISVDGGLSRSSYFCRFLADALQRTVRVPAFDELTALGCAALAHPDGSLPASAGAERVRYAPRPVDAASWLTRFAAARERASGWHR